MSPSQDVDPDPSRHVLSHESRNPDESEDSSEASISSPSFSPIAFSSATSYDELESIRSLDLLSPAPSVYSLTSSLREQSFRREFGRKINNYSEIYRLPADEEEIARLEKQHTTFTRMMGPWVPPLPDVMAPEPGNTKSVLDLGCGTGAWLISVAREFPECSAVGVDLVPVQATSTMPPNCRFEVDDINLGLEHFYNTFDVVHAGFISTGIKDYADLMDHMARCLRPRGLLTLYEVDCRIYNLDKTLSAPWSPSPPIDDAPYICRWLFALGNSVRRRGGHIDAGPLLPLWVHQHYLFTKEDFAHHEYWCPIGHSADWGVMGLYSAEVAEMLRDDFITLLPGGRPLLLGNGMLPEDVDHLQTNAQRELEELKTPLLMKFHSVYARKKAVG